MQAAARIIAGADAILIGAGAGIGVDSGLPDFRGEEGFWKAYPIFRQSGLRFEDLANPRWFPQDPQQAWGFYGHRLNLYLKTTPHSGFGILLKWAEQLPSGAFVFTSNVDVQPRLWLDRCPWECATNYSEAQHHYHSFVRR